MDLCYFSEGVVQFLDIMEKDSIIIGEESLMDSTRILLESVYKRIPIIDPTQVPLHPRGSRYLEQKLNFFHVDLNFDHVQLIFVVLLYRSDVSLGWDTIANS